MSEILLCNQSIRSGDLHKHCGVRGDQISALDCANPAIFNANKPYVIGGDNTATEQAILSLLSPQPVARELTNLSLAYGEDNVLALSEMVAQLNEHNMALAGAATSAYGQRMNGFLDSAQYYQKALMDFREAIETNSPSKNVIKNRVYYAFEKFQKEYNAELSHIKNKLKTKKGIPLTNPDRALNVATSSRNVAKLDISSRAQAENLVKFTKFTKFIGNGLAVIDFSSRVGNVRDTYKAKGNWEKQLFIESTSFAGSAIAGSITVKAGMAGLIFFATPLGWAGLIFGGLAVVGSAAAATIIVNDSVKGSAGDAYDKIMESIL